MINNMFMKDYDTFQKELKEGKIEHPEDWTIIDVEKARRANMDDFAKLIFDKKAREINLGDLHLNDFNSLAELNEEWEDYTEEQKGYWYINEFGTPTEIIHTRENIYDKQRKNFGNYFETKEEAEKAVEKLKAWKRLKDKGFRFEGIKEDYTRILRSQNPFRTGKRYLQFNKSEDEDWMKENWKDLDLLFGGEE